MTILDCGRKSNRFCSDVRVLSDNLTSKIQNLKLLWLVIAVLVSGELHAGEAPKWQAEWDRTVRAAEQEGQVNVSIGGYGAVIESGVF
jgi:hypothetical protein